MQRLNNNNSSHKAPSCAAQASSFATQVPPQRSKGILVVEQLQTDYDGNIFQEERSEAELYNRNVEFRERCLTWKGKLGRMEICFNPLSTLSAATIIWGVIIWALRESDTNIVYFQQAQRWITDRCTWIYVASQAVWTIFLFVVYFKFGHIKLGLAKDIPEYSNFDYFVMIFTTGVSNGFLQDSVAGSIPLFKNNSANAINYWGSSSEENRAQNALNIMVFHWGFHGFCVYIIPALLIAALAYRKGLPVTMRTCFYPVFGRKIFGRAGDVVDSLTLICIAFGASTSFMIGSNLLIVALKILNDSISDTKENFIVATWVITLMASISAMTGLQLGIRRMSQLCFITGMLFICTVAFSDDIWFILNSLVQSFGYYLQYFIGMSAYTGAFQQKWQSRKTSMGNNDFDWMHNYTVFYWGWWIGWASFVSIFIARLSRGRYIKEVIVYTYILPVCVSTSWNVVMGAISLDMQHCMLHQSTCNITEDVSGKFKDIKNLSSMEQFFFTLNKYEDISGFLHVLAMIVVVLYYVTSFDTVSLVMDSISSNGETDPPIVQRIFWSITIGATTTALIFYDDGRGLERVHAFAVICGLPLTIVFCFCTVALWRFLRKEPGWRYDLEVKWKMFYGHIDSLELLKKFILTVFLPWYFLGDVFIKKNKILDICDKVLVYIKFALPFYLWIVLLCLSAKYKNVDNIGWTFLLGFFFYSAVLRKEIRERYIIEGNLLEDTCLMVLYPFTIIQMYVQMDVLQANGEFLLDNKQGMTGKMNQAFSLDQKVSFVRNSVGQINTTDSNGVKQLAGKQTEVLDL